MYTATQFIHTHNQSVYITSMCCHKQSSILYSNIIIGCIYLLILFTKSKIKQNYYIYINIHVYTNLSYSTHSIYTNILTLNLPLYNHRSQQLPARNQNNAYIVYI